MGKRGQTEASEEYRYSLNSTPPRAPLWRSDILRCPHAPPAPPDLGYPLFMNLIHIFVLHIPSVSCPSSRMDSS